MESQYSVGLSNRFSLFYEDDDNPGDVIATTKDKSKEEKRPPTGVTSKAKETTKEKQPPQSQNNQSVSKKGSASEGTARVTGGTGRGERGRFPRNDQDTRRRDGQGRDNMTQRGPPRERERRSRPPREKDEVFQSGSVGSRDEKPMPFRDNRLGSRGRGRGRGGGFRGKREFDRHSGSDRSSIKPVEKREGSGGYNWGTVHDDLNALSPDDEWPNEEPESVSNGVNGVAVAEPNETVDKRTPQEEPATEEKESAEPVVVEMTLDEYRAKMEPRHKPQYQERTVENGTGEWKGSIKFQRHDDEYIPSQREVIEKIKTSGRKVTPLQTSFHFKDPARRGRGRTGGMPTGLRGNRERRSSGGRRDRAPNMTDPEDFPALNISTS